MVNYMFTINTRIMLILGMVNKKKKGGGGREKIRKKHVTAKLTSTKANDDNRSAKQVSF